MTGSGHPANGDGGDWRTAAIETVADGLHRRIDEFARDSQAPDELVQKGHDLVDELATTMEKLAAESSANTGS